eukprot:3170033-Rhodomonas_salina.1
MAGRGQVEEGCYIRGDLTLARYLSGEEFRRAFEAAGFEAERCEVEERRMYNRCVCAVAWLT